MAAAGFLRVIALGTMQYVRLRISFGFHDSGKAFRDYIFASMYVHKHAYNELYCRPPCPRRRARCARMPSPASQRCASSWRRRCWLWSVSSRYVTRDQWADLEVFPPLTRCHCIRFVLFQSQLACSSHVTRNMPRCHWLTGVYAHTTCTAGGAGGAASLPGVEGPGIPRPTHPALGRPPRGRCVIVPASHWLQYVAAH
jgi:hypothetical protein